VLPDKISFTSDYFEQIEELGLKMLTLGKAYCDDTSVEQMRKERMDGIESASRNRSVEDNIRIFNEMKVYSDKVYLRVTFAYSRVVNSVFAQKYQ
jgi:glutamyl/glutaminyl-tRNA synthetase